MAGGVSSISVEILDTSNQMHCNDWPDLPGPVQNVTGGLLYESKALICGLPNKKCFIIDKDGSSVNSVSTRKDRNGASSIVIEEGKSLMIVGSVESTMMEKINTTSKDNIMASPFRNNGNCLAKINASTAISTGGARFIASANKTRYYNYAWRYSIQHSYWNRTADMRQKRAFHSCGLGWDLALSDNLLFFAQNKRNRCIRIFQTFLTFWLLVEPLLQTII